MTCQSRSRANLPLETVGNSDRDSASDRDDLPGRHVDRLCNVRAQVHPGCTFGLITRKWSRRRREPTNGDREFHARHGGATHYRAVRVVANAGPVWHDGPAPWNRRPVPKAIHSRSRTRGVDRMQRCVVRVGCAHGGAKPAELARLRGRTSRNGADRSRAPRAIWRIKPRPHPRAPPSAGGRPEADHRAKTRMPTPRAAPMTVTRHSRSPRKRGHTFEARSQTLETPRSTRARSRLRTRAANKAH